MIQLIIAAIIYKIKYFLHNLQDPVNCHDERDVIRRQTHWCQYDHHGNQAGLRDAGRTKAGSCSGDAAGNRNTRSSMLLFVVTKLFIYGLQT